MNLHFTRTNGPADEAVDRIMEMVEGIERPEIVREMIIAALKAGQEDDGKADLKLMSATLKEMRYTSKVFGLYRDFRKVAAFGSARTVMGHPAYELARSFGKQAAGAGYMVITGGGGGIMQAVNEGAGPEHSFGVNIRLPFEQKPNPILEKNPRHIMFKYFFNRKVAFVKEADAVALFPGGFGTLDEAMETLTLVQTGKRDPLPILLLDEPGSTYWENWLSFVKNELLADGYVSDTDFHFFEQVHSAEEAVDRIVRFYRRYHSLRFIGDRLSIRLTTDIPRHGIDALGKQFSDIIAPGGELFLSGPLPVESDQPELSHLPRLVLDFNRQDFGRLRALIDAVNRI